jgi:hypothetical protein
MAIARLETKVRGRGVSAAGRTAAAASAYLSSTEVYDEYRGKLERGDKNREQRVVHAEVMLPEGAPSWMMDRTRLWYAAECAEDAYNRKASSAMVAREWLVSLPHEWTLDQKIEGTRGFIEKMALSRGLVAEFGIHEPEDKPGVDARNWHSHILVSTRAVDLSDRDGIGFSQSKAYEPGYNRESLIELRQSWEYHVNGRMAEWGYDARISMESHAARGTGLIPEPKLGPQATAMEREGRESHAGNDWRAVRAENDNRQRNAELTALRAETAGAAPNVIDLADVRMSPAPETSIAALEIWEREVEDYGKRWNEVHAKISEIRDGELPHDRDARVQAAEESWHTTNPYPRHPDLDTDPTIPAPATAETSTDADKEALEVRHETTKEDFDELRKSHLNATFGANAQSATRPGAKPKAPDYSGVTSEADFIVGSDGYTEQPTRPGRPGQPAPPGEEGKPQADQQDQKSTSAQRIEDIQPDLSEHEKQRDKVIHSWETLRDRTDQPTPEDDFRTEFAWKSRHHAESCRESAEQERLKRARSEPDGIRSPGARYAEALGETEGSDWISTGIQAAMKEYQIFAKEIQELAVAAALEQDPEKRRIIELQSTVLGAGYQTITNNRCGGHADYRYGGTKSEAGDIDRSRAQEWQEIGDQARAERAALLEQVAQREQQAKDQRQQAEGHQPEQPTRPQHTNTATGNSAGESAQAQPAKENDSAITTPEGALAESGRPLQGGLGGRD